MHKEGWRHQLRWSNPYTDPPDGLPRILAEWVNKEPTINDFRKIYPRYKLGCGYRSAIIFPERKIKHLSAKTKKQANQRRKKTIKMLWVKKHLPLFAEQIIQEEQLDWRKEQKTTYY